MCYPTTSVELSHFIEGCRELMASITCLVMDGVLVLGIHSLSILKFKPFQILPLVYLLYHFLLFMNPVLLLWICYMSMEDIGGTVGLSVHSLRDTAIWH